MQGKVNRRNIYEALLSDICTLFEKQQEKADERFLKREEERRLKESQIEETMRTRGEHEMMKM